MASRIFSRTHVITQIFFGSLILLRFEAMQTPSANCVHDRAISWESLLEETKYTRAHAKESASRRPKDLTSVKAGSVLRNEAAITASWGRLIDNIETEASVIAEAGADIVPSIEFKDIRCVSP